MKKPKPYPKYKPEGRVLLDSEGPVVFKLSLSLYIFGILSVYYYPFIMPSFWLAAYMT